MSGTQSATLTTTDATPALFPNLPVLPAATAAQRMTGQAIALNQATGNTAIWDVAVAVSRLGTNGAPVTVGTPSITLYNVPPAEMAGVSLAFSLQASGFGLLATGLAGTTIQWSGFFSLAQDNLPVAYASGTISDPDKVDIRRFCGYPAYGDGGVVFPMPWIMRQYLALEYRLNHITPTEILVVQQYLTQLRTLETAIVTAGGQTLIVDQAAVFKRNARELKERNELFDSWRRRLCGFLGVPPGEALGQGGLQMVV